MFIGKDSNLTKSHVRFLEKALYDVAQESITTIEVLNKTTPTGSKLPQSDKDEMEEFKESIMFILENLNFLDFVEDKETNIDDKAIDEPIFSLSLAGSKSLYASLKIVNNSYRLLKGSCIRKSDTSSSKNHNYYNLRTKLIENNYFEEKEDHYVLLKDVDFSSPSVAASIVRNLTQNGRRKWKLEDGTSLDEYEVIRSE